MPLCSICIFRWPVSREYSPQKPGRIEHSVISVYVVILGGVSEIQTSLDVSDLKKGHKRSRRIDLLLISHAQLPVSDQKTVCMQENVFSEALLLLSMLWKTKN